MKVKSVYQVIRGSGTRVSGQQEIRDKNVPDNLISRSPSPGYPDILMTAFNVVVKI